MVFAKGPTGIGKGLNESNTPYFAKHPRLVERLSAKFGFVIVWPEF